MKNLLIYLSLMVLVATSCKNDYAEPYQAEDSIYFNFTDTNNRKEIRYTFAYTPGKIIDTISIPVKLSGARVPYARTFRLAIIDTATTAIAGQHYDALNDEYTLEADSGTFDLPIVIHNTDILLDTESVSIAFTLVESNDLKVNIPHLITGKITFSNRLEKPNWWPLWQNDLGEYSRVKHSLFLISSGTIDLIYDMATQNGDIPKTLHHISQYKTFLRDPFTWITSEEGEAYTLSQRSEGVYDFYQIDLPEKKYELRKDTQSGAYFFIDENGNLIY